MNQQELDVQLLDAVWNNDAASANQLLANGASIEAQDDQGRTALILACQEGALDVARLLMASAADVNAATPDGSTSLMPAFSSMGVTASSHCWP